MTVKLIPTIKVEREEGEEGDGSTVRAGNPRGLGRGQRGRGREVDEVSPERAAMCALRYGPFRQLS